MKVGTIVELNTTYQKDIIIAKGVVFATYLDDESKLGVRVIFENGYFDKFPYKEQEEYLTELGFSEEHSNYVFVDIPSVSRNFESGYWESVFKKDK